MNELTVILPGSPTRTELRSFALTMGGGIGMIVAGGLALFGETAAVPAGLGLLVLLGGAGWIKPDLVNAPYVGWNRLARFCARAGEFWTTAVLFYVLLPLVGSAGSRMPWAPVREGDSGWRERERPPEESDGRGYTAQHGEARPTGSGWPSSLVSWAGATGNPWAWGLVPFIALLRAFRPRVRSSLGENIYTLY